MAVTQNTYTGNGSTTNYSFTFPYLETTDIKVSVNGTNTTAYTLANATTIQFNTAPANGAAIRIYRQTDDAALAATFYPGSAIRSADLNENFTQNLYVTQESTNNAATATTTANTALTNSATAIGTANTALSTANTASSNASAAVSTANTASSNASAAVSTANTASSNATTAVNTANAATATANSATSTANTALSTANAATSTANAASTAATTAVNTANAASSAASSAVSTANTASTNASNAVTTANTASTNATTAVNTANTAVTTANAAAAAVANAVLYTTVANVAAIPASPANNTAIEVTNSTGIESFTPLSGKPAGFIGSSGLSVRIIYQTTGSTWTWIQYFPNDPETRYLKTGSTGTVTSTMIADGTIADSDINAAAAISLSKLATGALPTAITVASSNIVDGTIVNGDINASAAIAGTKISPDFGSQNVTTSGVISAAAGSAGSPSITFTGDLNTGIYSPGADQVAISTGGSGRLFVDASGNVEIASSGARIRGDFTNGTLANRVSFQTTTANSSTVLQVLPSGTGTASQVRLFNNSDAANSGGGRFFTTSGAFGLEGQISGTGTYLPLTFQVGGSEALRITSAGLVGVGTSSPGSILHCNSGSAADVYVRTSNSAASSGFDVGVSSGGIAYVFNRNNTDLRIGTNGAERVTVTAGGNVGIGTTSPAHTLDVKGSIVRISNPGSGIASLEIGDGATGNQYAYIDLVGDTTYTDYGLRVFRYNTGANAPSVLYHRGTGALGFNAVDSGPFTFVHNNAERARIDSSGRLLVGTSSARVNFFNSTLSALLQVEGADHENSSVSLIRNTIFGGTQYGPNLVLASTGSNTIGSNTVSLNGGYLGTISFQGTDGSKFVQAAEITAQVDGTPGANDMPGRLVFSTTADGASSSVERLRITNDGVQCYNQAAPVAKTAAATLTPAELKVGIITYSSASNANLTMPTGTDLEAAFPGIYTNMTFEFSVINLSSGTPSIATNTGITIVGGNNAGNSARFAVRRTAANTFTVYRLS